MTTPPEPPGDTRAPTWLPRAAVTVAVVILGVIGTLWVVSRLRGLLFMVFIALFVAVALEPAVQFLAKRGWRRGVATSVVFLATFVVATGFVAALVPLFINEAADLVRNMPRYVANVQQWLDSQDIEIDLLDPAILRDIQGLGSLLQRFGAQMAGGVFAVGNTVFSAIFRTVTIALFAYYMVAEAPKLRRTVLGFLPPTRQRVALRIWEIAVDRTGGYIYSRMILAGVAAAFTAVVLTLLGVPYPVALGLWVGLLSQFVPVIGTYIAAVLPVLVALGEDPFAALWVLLALVGYQQLENYVVAPRITAAAMSIHPAVSVGAIIAGVSLLGGIGAVLALPVAAIIQAVISTAIRRHELIESEAFEDETVPSRRRGRGSRQEPRRPRERGLGDGDVEPVEGMRSPRVQRESG